MKIALVGYGKMGKAIEQIAMDFNGEIVLRINSENQLEDHLETLQDIDVAIEFSTPSAAFTNLKLLIEHGVDVVCGSTAWLDRWDEIVALNKQYQTALDGFLKLENDDILSANSSNIIQKMTISELTKKLKTVANKVYN